MRLEAEESRPGELWSPDVQKLAGEELEGGGGEGVSGRGRDAGSV